MALPLGTRGSVRRLARLAALALAGLVAGTAGAEEAGRSVKVPVGLPVGMNGLVSPAEWDDATVLAMGEEAATVKVKQSRGTLLLAVETDRIWPRGTHLLLYVCPDLPEANALSAGAVTLDYEPLEHNRPHLMVRRVLERGAEELADAAVVRARVNDKHPTLEIALRLPALGVTGKNAPPRRLAVALARAASGGTPSWPAGLDLGADPSKPPPDLASSARWGRLAGWVDPDGPGALPKADWDALLAEDRELTAQGARAHAKAFEIIEEGGHKLEKEDAVAEREVLDPFAWIAAREPLHPYDVFVRAQVLRRLNRHAEALASLEALALVREGDYEQITAEERALTLGSMQRFEAAAAAWERVAELARPGDRARFLAAAEQARARAKDLAREVEARAADAADDALPLVELRTSRGSFFARLHGKDVPRAVAHFLALAATPAKDGGGLFYDGTLFQRVVGDGFVQGGDPRTRTGGCDTDLTGPASATIPVEVDARHGFWRGALAFARGTQLENASQFFVLTTPRPELAKAQLTCFGHVVAGLDVVDRLERCDTLLAVRPWKPAAPPAPPAPPTPVPPAEPQAAPGAPAHPR